MSKRPIVNAGGASLSARPLPLVDVNPATNPATAALADAAAVKTDPVVTSRQTAVRGQGRIFPKSYGKPVGKPLGGGFRAVGQCDRVFRAPLAGGWRTKASREAG